MSIWNPWHGCHKISPGCLNCYVYRRDESIGKDAGIISRTKNFDLPIKLNRQKNYKLSNEEGTVFTCMTSDFFIEEADMWRDSCWDMIRTRKDLHFHIITKRINRAIDCFPEDWNEGWDNVTIASTCENQEKADERIPILLSLPLKHREIICEPLLEKIDIQKYLSTGMIEHVTCGGESGTAARPCDFSWITDIRLQCVREKTSFTFKQTGAVFIKNGRTYHIDRKDQIPQAKRSGYSYIPGQNSGENISYTLPNRNVLFEKLSRSPFRSRFSLSDKDKAYVKDKGIDTIRKHTEDFIRERLSPECPRNDSKQTPMRGHPAFPAQHATACCCRGCLEKWHHIPSGKQLTSDEQKYIVDTVMHWINLKLACD